MSADTQEGQDEPTPTADDVADRLGVRRDRLQRFVNFHPNPTAVALVGWAYADPEHEEAVAAWLEANRTEPADFSDADPVARDDGRRGWVVR